MSIRRMKKSNKEKIGMGLTYFIMICVVTYCLYASIQNGNEKNAIRRAFLENACEARGLEYHSDYYVCVDAHGAMYSIVIGVTE